MILLTIPLCMCETKKAFSQFQKVVFLCQARIQYAQVETSNYTEKHPKAASPFKGCIGRPLTWRRHSHFEGSTKCDLQMRSLFLKKLRIYRMDPSRPQLSQDLMQAG